MDEVYMREALKEARLAYNKGEVPIGAVVVYKGEIIGRGHNQKESLQDPTAHGEILAIKEATSRLKNWRLTGASIYTSLEPCPMCAGAIVNSRITRLVIGARDERYGACGSLLDITGKDFNHRVEVDFGVLSEEASKILSDFFTDLRKTKA